MQTRYYRKVSGLSNWRKDKNEGRVTSDENSDYFLKTLVRGSGSPSVWKVRTDKELEQVCLGMVLSVSNQKQPIRFIGFDQECFDIAEIPLLLEEDAVFPIPDVMKLHYVLDQDENSPSLRTLIDTFLECKGVMKEFRFDRMGPDKEKSILDIADAYDENSIQKGEYKTNITKLRQLRK